MNTDLNRLATVVAASGLLLLFSMSSAGAALMSMSSDLQQLEDPDSGQLGEHVAESNVASYLLQEQSEYELGNYLLVDFLIDTPDYGESYTSSDSRYEWVMPGTFVDSYIISSDKIGDSKEVQEFHGTVQFETKILGVMISNMTLKMSAHLEKDDVDYVYHGYESAGPVSDYFRVLDGYTLEYNHSLNTAWDQIRVITEAAPKAAAAPVALVYQDPIPEPATIVALLSVAFIVISQRRRITSAFTAREA